MSTTAEVHIETLSDEPTPPTGETPTVGTSTHRTTIAAISIKLPLFWPADPTVWFARLVRPGRSTVQHQRHHFAENALQLSDRLPFA